MPLIALVARVDFEYLGRDYATGERFEVAPIHAAVLTHDRRAAFAPKVAPDRPSKPKCSYVRRPPSSSKRTYRRRDLVPEE